MTMPCQTTVLVTGAGRGLGAAGARLRARGRALPSTIVTAPRLPQRWPKSWTARATFQGDVTDHAQVADMVAQITERFGSPDVLVHNALSDYSFNGDARSTLDRCNGQRLPSGDRRGGCTALHSGDARISRNSFGRVVTIGSGAEPGVPYHDYTAAKGAFWPLPAPPLGPMGVTVNMGGLLRTSRSRTRPLGT